MKTRILHSLALITTLALAGCGGPPAGRPGGDMVVNVSAIEAQPKPLEETIALVATLAANESVEILSEVEGTVLSVHFEEGQPVAEGALLLQLDTRKLEAHVAEAEASYTLAEANRKRAETMLENRTISQQEADQALSTYAARKASLDLVREQLRESRITAPFGGITGARLVSPGQVITKATPLTRLVDIAPLKADFQVSEQFLGQLNVDQEIALRVAAYPGEEFRGVVYFLDPQVDAATRTVLVKATLPNEDGRLRPGMFGNLDLVLRVKDRAILVPERAIMMAGDRASLFVIDSTGHAAPAAVKLGQRVAGSVEITAGLSGGELVVVEGLQKLRPGVAVSTNAPAR